jgi:hypothetical protein
MATQSRDIETEFNNPWQSSSRVREPVELLKPAIDPAGWYPADFAERDSWMYRLSAPEIAELHDAVAAVEARGLDLKDVGKDNFLLPTLGATLAEIADEIMMGRGFALIRGLPVEGRSRYQVAAAFWGIGAHMGEARSQNTQGHLLGHVKDIGGSYATGRGYMSRDALLFHSDRADILSLGCLQTAKSGGDHRICSSVTIYNEMLKRRPDLLKELTWRFYRIRKGEIPPGQPQRDWVREPIFSVEQGFLTARGPSAPVFKAQSLPDVPKLTEAQKEAITMFSDLAKEVSMGIDYEPGDISFVMNHVTQHARTDYEDWHEPERKRHLLRLWLRTGRRPLQEDVAQALAGVEDENTVFQTPLDAE